MSSAAVEHLVLPAERYPVDLSTVWQMIEPRHRKAILIVCGMDAVLDRKQRTYQTNGRPNAGFYCEQPFGFLPPEWQRKVHRFLQYVERCR